MIQVFAGQFREHVSRVGQEFSGAGQTQRDRLAEVEKRGDLVENGGGVGDVDQGEAAVQAAFEQGAGVDGDQRIVIEVENAPDLAAVPSGITHVRRAAASRSRGRRTGAHRVRC